LIIAVLTRARLWVTLVALAGTPQLALAQFSSDTEIEISSGTTNASDGIDQFLFVYQLLSDRVRIVTRIDAIAPGC
jgi:hypothetical protein